MKSAMLFTSVIMLCCCFFSCMSDQSNEIEPNNLVLESRDSEIGSSCLGDAPSPCYEGVYTWSITLPDYPNCELIVEQYYYVCYGLNFANFHLGGFDYTINLGCDDFLDDQETAILQGTEEQFITYINQQIWEQITENLLSGLSGSYYEIAEFEYNVGSCKFLCGSDQLRCGDVCCRKVNKWERDSSGDWYLSEEGEIERFGDSCLTYQNPGCSPSELQSQDCFDNCASLEF
jgi:hypothetical protein